MSDGTNHCAGEKRQCQDVKHDTFMSVASGPIADPRAANPTHHQKESPYCCKHEFARFRFHVGSVCPYALHVPSEGFLLTEGLVPAASLPSEGVPAVKVGPAEVEGEDDCGDDCEAAYEECRVVDRVGRRKHFLRGIQKRREVLSRPDRDDEGVDEDAQTLC